jgi:hypothetical protein
MGPIGTIISDFKTSNFAEIFRELRLYILKMGPIGTIIFDFKTSNCAEIFRELRLYNSSGFKPVIQDCVRSRVVQGGALVNVYCQWLSLSRTKKWRHT